MTLIQDLEGIHCEKCGEFIPKGDYAYNDGGMNLCEECMDKALEEFKKENRHEVNNYWFDLEKEVRQ